MTEQIFGIAGFGRLTVDSIAQRDYALLQGVVLVVAVGYVVVNLLVDVAYSLINPRHPGRGNVQLSYVEATPLGARARRRRILRRRFLRRPAAVASLLIVVGAILAAVFAKWVAPYPPEETDFEALLASPSREHLLGTDDLGRDTLSRIIWGARASIQAGFLATVLAMAVAVPIGLIGGYYRGWLDTVIARVTDVLLAFPFLILAVGLAAILGPSAPERDAGAGHRCDPAADQDRPR